MQTTVYSERLTATRTIFFSALAFIMACSRSCLSWRISASPSSCRWRNLCTSAELKQCKRRRYISVRQQHRPFSVRHQFVLTKTASLNGRKIGAKNNTKKQNTRTHGTLNLCKINTAGTCELAVTPQKYGNSLSSGKRSHIISGIKQHRSTVHRYQPKCAPPGPCNVITETR